MVSARRGAPRRRCRPRRGRRRRRAARATVPTRTARPAPAPGARTATGRRPSRAAGAARRRTITTTQKASATQPTACPARRQPVGQPGQRDQQQHRCDVRQGGAEEPPDRRAVAGDQLVAEPEPEARGRDDRDGAGDRHRQVGELPTAAVAGRWRAGSRRRPSSSSPARSQRRGDGEAAAISASITRGDGVERVDDRPAALHEHVLGELRVAEQVLDVVADGAVGEAGEEQAGGPARDAGRAAAARPARATRAAVDRPRAGPGRAATRPDPMSRRSNSRSATASSTTTAATEIRAGHHRSPEKACIACPQPIGDSQDSAPLPTSPTARRTYDAPMTTPVMPYIARVALGQLRGDQRDRPEDQPGQRGGQTRGSPTRRPRGRSRSGSPRPARRAGRWRPGR